MVERQVAAGLMVMVGKYLSGRWCRDGDHGFPLMALRHLIDHL